MIFDWDGTLADSVSKIIACKHAIALQYDQPIPDSKIIRSVIGIDFVSAMYKCFPKASPRVFQKLCSNFHNMMQQPEYQADLFPYAKDELLRLKNLGYQLAIATSKNSAELSVAIKHHKLENIFDLTCSSDQYLPKPQPLMLKYILTKLHTNPNNCVMFGDTVTDILFAKNANVKIICVTFGVDSKKVLAQENPHGFINSWQNVAMLLNKANIGK